MKNTTQNTDITFGKVETRDVYLTDLPQMELLILI